VPTAHNIQCISDSGHQRGFAPARKQAGWVLQDLTHVHQLFPLKVSSGVPGSASDYAPCRAPGFTVAVLLLTVMFLLCLPL